MMNRIFGWGTAALWAAVLFLLSEQEHMGGANFFVGADKLAHAGLYAVLGLSLAWGKHRTGSNISVFMLLLMGAGYGALDEWHQSFVATRDVSVGDWVADSVGVVMGLMLFSLMSSRSARSGRLPDEGRTTEGTTTLSTTTTGSH
jgi:VanZ family protein